MAESKSGAAGAKSSSNSGATSSSADVPASRTFYRHKESGLIGSAEAVERDAKSYEAHHFDANYTGDLVNVQRRANGLRITVDIECDPTLEDAVRTANPRIGFSVK